jgi:hypothetical protein
VLASQHRLEYFKVFPLYHIGSKSPDLFGDRLFWNLLTALTVSNKIISTASSHKQLSIIASCISKLPNITWVNEDIIDEICE